MTYRTAWILRRIIDGLPICSEIRFVDPYYRDIAWRLLGLPVLDRPRAWIRYLDDFDPSSVRNRVWSFVAKIDPHRPMIFCPD